MSRILLIEDNAADVDLLKRSFAAHGNMREVVALEDGEQALRFLDNLRTKADLDLVIIDLNIPQHDGIEVLTRYRMQTETAGVPVAVFTSSGSPAEKNHAMRLGVDAYLRKPMELDEYMAMGVVFREILDRAR